MSRRKQKNGTVELMRFVFCIAVILFHIGNRTELTLPDWIDDEWFSCFRHGNMGVEFFFIISGYFMTANAKRRYGIGKIASNTVSFIYRKTLGVYPYHFVAWVISTVLFFCFKNYDTLFKAVNKLLELLPSLFLLQKSGIYSTEIMTVEWYIGAMLICMLFLYPLILKFKDKFTKIVAPLLTVLLIGYMMIANDKLSGTNRIVFNDTVPKVYVRAFAEMCGGVFAYEVSVYIRKLRLNKIDRVICTVIEAVCYLCCIYYTFSSFSHKYEAHIYYMLLVAVIFTFAETSYIDKIFNNSFVYFLGKTSLPLYISQNIAFLFLVNVYPEKSDAFRIFSTLAITAAFAVVIWFAGKYLQTFTDKKLHTFKKTVNE